MGSVRPWPCVKCGAVDRYKSGDCRPCILAGQKKRRLADPEKHNRGKQEKIKNNLEHFRSLDAEWINKNLERHMLIRSRRTAKLRGWDFNLELSDIVIPETCPILGCKLERRTDGSRRKSPGTPSLDRIDSSLGYVKGNVWVISWRANAVKTDASLDELRLLVTGLERATRLRLVGS